MELALKRTEYNIYFFHCEYEYGVYVHDAVGVHIHSHFAPLLLRSIRCIPESSELPFLVHARCSVFADKINRKDLQGEVAGCYLIPPFTKDKYLRIEEILLRSGVNRTEVSV